MTDNLRAWLLPLRQAEDAVCELQNAPNAIARCVTAVNKARAKRGVAEKFAWKHNALRHSFISYRLAAIQNADQVALEAGTSRQMIFKHYRELVTATEAKEWFAITPETVAAARLKSGSAAVASESVPPPPPTTA